jgi:alkanesulfonate monooxygenase SsuD/methylene tetrahydromethanopterin reductase-like flavin-dependent oxidoreductase (luciferase family)
MSYGICPSAVTLAAYVLGRTRRVGVGTAVRVLSTWHPVALAEQAALLDQVSAGRFRLGAGRGGPWMELEVFGTGLDRYETGFAEGPGPDACRPVLGPGDRGGQVFQLP